MGIKTLDMKKNAGIRSKKELARRLIDGEEFYSNGIRIFFDENEGYPFRYDDRSLITSWGFRGFIENLQTKVDWRDNIGDGVLCWVWDYNPNDKYVRIVARCNYELEYCYISATGAAWKNAEPMTREEVEKYILE